MVGETAVLANGTAQRKIDELTKTVEQRIERLEMEMLSGHSTAFLDALSWWSKQYRFSFNNSQLIEAQFPHASFVAGYRQLQAMGWQVAKGERAIYIRGPWTRKEVDEATGEITHRLIGYLPLAVFDISQTIEWEQGKRLPERLQPATGAEWAALYDAWRDRLQTIHHIAVIERPMGRVYGTAMLGEIRINSTLVEAKKATTLLHEVCHIAAGHCDKRDKEYEQRELEAEASTFVLAGILGAEHPMSHDYLLMKQVEPGSLKASLEIIGQIVKRVKTMLQIGFEDQVIVEASELAAA